MNTTIRKLYTFKKKEKSFDKTYAALYVRDLLTSIEPKKLDFMETENSNYYNYDDDQIQNQNQNYEIIAEEQALQTIDLDNLEVDYCQSQKQQQQQQQQLQQQQQQQQQQIESFGLEYRIKKKKNQKYVVACKVPLRKHKFRENYNEFNDPTLIYERAQKKFDNLRAINDFHRELQLFIEEQY